MKVHKDSACPDCKGVGGYEGPPDCVAVYEGGECFDGCGCPTDLHPCLTCRGTGELVGLARATYLARGGPAPVPRRGFA